MIDFIAPLAGLLVGVANLSASAVRFSRGDESLNDLLGWVGGHDIIMSLAGWHVRTLGLFAAVGYPAALASVEVVFYVKSRRARARIGEAGLDEVESECESERGAHKR